MTGQQTAITTAQDMHQRGLTDSPNVEVVRMMGVRIVENKIPAQVRRELMAAVKSARLGYIAKDGLKPQAFFHPNSRAKALEQRNRIAMASIEAIRKVCAPIS